MLSSSGLAQQPGVHYYHQGAMPPGAIGSQQLQRGGPLPGYYQPVEIKAPSGAAISLAVDGQFEEPRKGLRKAGLLIGSVYRLRVTDIPLAEGQEVFPTIEVIDRLFTPLGQEHRFSIPVELSEEDLKLALAGKFVTRVIYWKIPAMPCRSATIPSNKPGSKSRPAKIRWPSPIVWAGRWRFCDWAAACRTPAPVPIRSSSSAAPPFVDYPNPPAAVEKPMPRQRN